MASAPPSTAARPSAGVGRTRPPLAAGLRAGLLLGALWIISGAIARLSGSDIVLTRLRASARCRVMPGCSPARGASWYWR